MQTHGFLPRLNHRLTIEIGRGRLSQSIGGKRLCQLVLENAVDNEAHFVFMCPLYNSIRRQTNMF